MPETDAVLGALSALAAKIDAQRVTTDEQGRKLDLILNAFPNSDVTGHRAYHTAVMDALADRKRIRQAVLEHVLKTSTWVVLAGLAMFSVQSVRQWLRGAAA